MDFTRVSDEELQSRVDEYEKSCEVIGAMQSELARRLNEKQRQEASAKREKTLSSEKFKKIQARYQQVVGEMKGLAGSHEQSLVLPLTFKTTVDYPDIGRSPFEYWSTKKLTSVYCSNEVTGALGKVKGLTESQKAVFDAGLDQLFDGNDWNNMFPALEKAKQKAVDDLNKFMADASEKYDQVAKSLFDLADDAEMTYFLPLTFTANIKYVGPRPAESDFGHCSLEVGNVFEYEGMTVGLGKVKGMNESQEDQLRIKIDEMVENACEQVYDVFPGIRKRMEKAVADVNKIFYDAAECGLRFEDLCKQ